MRFARGQHAFHIAANWRWWDLYVRWTGICPWDHGWGSPSTGSGLGVDHPCMISLPSCQPASHSPWLCQACCIGRAFHDLMCVNSHNRRIDKWYHSNVNGSFPCAWRRRCLTALASMFLISYLHIGVSILVQPGLKAQYRITHFKMILLSYLFLFFAL